MRKPEPSDVACLRGAPSRPCGCKSRKKRSKGLPGGKGSSGMAAAGPCAISSFTRMLTTAGFTFSTRSAKLGRRSSALAEGAAERVSSGAGCARTPVALMPKATMPAIASARAVRRFETCPLVRILNSRLVVPLYRPAGGEGAWIKDQVAFLILSKSCPKYYRWVRRKDGRPVRLKRIFVASEELCEAGFFLRAQAARNGPSPVAADDEKDHPSTDEKHKGGAKPKQPCRRAEARRHQHEIAIAGDHIIIDFFIRVARLDAVADNGAQIARKLCI